MEVEGAIILTIGLLSVLTNGILLAILFSDPLKKFSTPTNYFIKSLAISDLITGAAGCAYAFPEVTRSSALYGVFWATIISSFGTIFLMSCERLLVVLYPLRAKSLITHKRVFYSICGNWTCSLTIGGTIYDFRRRSLEDKTNDFFYLILVCFSFILILVLVLAIFYLIIIKKNTERRRNLHNNDTVISRSRKTIRRERRLTGVISLLVIILLLTVIPHVAAGMVFAAYKIFDSSAKIPKALDIFARYFFPVELVNFAVNPLVYAWRLPTYRMSLLHYVKRLRVICWKQASGADGALTRERTYEESMI